MLVIKEHIEYWTKIKTKWVTVQLRIEESSVVLRAL